jgi:amino acid transporter
MKCTNAGVPIYAVGVVSIITCVTFLVASENSVTVFYWFVDLTTTGLIASYTMMLVVFVGWYRARVAQGLNTASLYYTAPLTPWSAYLGLVLGCCALLFVGFDSFKPFSVQGFVTAYFCLPYTVILFFAWKFIKKTHMADPNTADLVSGKKEVDEECRHWEEGGIEENWKRELAGMTFWRRCWEKMW